MRASSYGGAGRFTTVDTPMPKPAASEALLRVQRVGICGTDLHIFQGHLDHRVPKGGVIGHETFADVAVAEINPYRIDILESYGLTTVGPDIDSHRFVEAWTNDDGVDVAFEVTG